MEFVIIGILVAIVIVIAFNIKVVPQATEIVIERLGKFYKAWGAGLHVKVPFIDAFVNKVTLKEQVLDTPPQPVITSDNVTMQIDAVVYYKIFDAKLYTYGVVNPVNALSNLTATTLRNIVGEMSLDEALTSRDTVNGKMQEILDRETDPWGIKVIRVEIKNIMPPEDIRAAMEKQMRAERERRETLLQAEGHKQAAITRAEGDKAAAILAAEGDRDARIARAEGEAKALLLQKEAEAEGLRRIKAVGADAPVLELKKYEALIKLADGKAAKIIVPSDVVDTVKKNVMFSEITGIGDHTDALPDAPAKEFVDECCEKISDDPEYRDVISKEKERGNSLE